MGLTDSLSISSYLPGQGLPAVLGVGNVLSCSGHCHMSGLSVAHLLSMLVSAPPAAKDSLQSPAVAQTSSNLSLFCWEAKPETSCPVSHSVGWFASAHLYSQVSYWNHHPEQWCSQQSEWETKESRAWKSPLICPFICFFMSTPCTGPEEIRSYPLSIPSTFSYMILFVPCFIFTSSCLPYFSKGTVVKPCRPWKTIIWNHLIRHITFILIWDAHASQVWCTPVVTLGRDAWWGGPLQSTNSV